MMIAFIAVVAGFMLLSAYGWTCVATEPERWNVYGVNTRAPIPYGYYAYEWYGTFGILLAAMYWMTWIMAGVWAFVIYALLTNRNYAYLLTVVSAAITFVIGLVPALLATTNGFTFTELQQVPYTGDPLTGTWVDVFEYDFFGTPHIAKAMMSILILVFLAPWPKSPIKKAFKSFSSRENRWGSGVGRQLAMMSIFFFWFGFISFLGSGFMADAHIVSGVNVWEIVQIQNIGGWVTTITGVSMLTTGLIYNKIKAPPSIITTS